MWQIIAIIFGVSVTILNGIMILIIRVNDLKHLEISVKDLKDTIEKSSGKVDLLAERISKIEGILLVKNQKE